MKSFFKKLAFVMAMAMVVSLAAPAAANAAVTGWENVIIANQEGDGSAVTAKVMTEGEKADFKFLGAPANWREYKRAWKVVDATGAATEGITVDANGLVVANKAGIYELQFTANEEVVASTQIIVNAPAPENEFTVEQSSLSELQVVFANPESKYDVDDVVLYLTYPKEGSDEPIKIKWPIKSASKKDGVITIAPYVLKDGDTYLVEIDGTEVFHTVKVGAVDTIVLSTKDNKHEVALEGKLEVSAKLYANGGKIDVTSTAANYDIEYDIEFVGEEDPDSVALKPAADTNLKAEVQLLKVGVTVNVVAKVVKDNKTIATTTSTCAVTCVEEEPWSFNGEVVDWCFINTAEVGNNAKNKVDWTLKTVPADKSYTGEYVIVLKIKNGNETYVTDFRAQQEDDDNDVENVWIDGTDAISKSFRRIRFYSTDENTMLVDAVTGAVGVYKEAEVAFYVALEDYSKDDVVTNYIYANTAKIGPASKLDDIVTADGKYECTVVSADLLNVNNPVITFKALDQYKNAWEAPVVYSAYYYNGTEKAVLDKWGNTAETMNQLTLTGSDFADKDTVETVYIEAKDVESGIVEKAEIKVTITKPNVDKDGNIVIDKMTKTYYNPEELAVVDNATVDLKNIELVTKTIKVYKTSNGAKVAEYATGTYVLIDGTEGKKESDIKNFANGTRYMMLKSPSGAIVPLTYDADGNITYTLNKLEAAVEGVTGQEFKYAEAGNYTLTYATVWQNTMNGNKNTSLVKTATITVNHKFDTVSIKGVKGDNKLTADCFNADGTINTDAVACEKVEYDKLDKVAGAVIAPEYVDVKAVVLNNAIIIQSITLRVYNEDETIYREIKMVPSSVISLKK